MARAVNGEPASSPPGGQPELFIFDLDGVIYRGDSVLPFVTDTLAVIERRGGVIFFLTNNSTQTREGYARKLEAMGIAASPDRIMTSAYATALYLQERHPESAAAYVVGEPGLVEELSRAGIRVTQGKCNGVVDTVVVGLDRQFTYEKLCCAQQAILAGARFIATNGDTTFPVEGGKLIPGGGAMVAAIQAATGVRPTLVGKPETYALRKISEVAGLPPERTVLVGDRLDTDVAAGRRMGFRTVLVLTGVTTAADAERAPAAMRPDHVIPDLACLLEIL